MSRNRSKDVSLCGKLEDFSSNLPHNMHFFELVITYPIFTLKNNAFGLIRQVLFGESHVGDSQPPEGKDGGVRVGGETTLEYPCGTIPRFGWGTSICIDLRAVNQPEAAGWVGVVLQEPVHQQAWYRNQAEGSAHHGSPGKHSRSAQPGSLRLHRRQ
jgi:hypothetical protein